MTKPGEKMRQMGRERLIVLVKGSGRGGYGVAVGVKGALEFLGRTHCQQERGFSPAS
jgi:hypothetical protein